MASVLCNDECANLSKVLERGLLHIDFINSFKTFSFNDSSLTPKKWQMFMELFGKVGEEAVCLVDQKAVMLYYHLNYGVYQVTTKCDIYTVLLNVKWCSCPEYEDLTLNNNSTCPHILACMLAEAMDQVQKLPTSAEHISQILAQLFNPDLLE